MNDRLAQLERRIRIQSRCLTAMALVLGACLFSSAFTARRASQESIPEVLRAHRIEVVDRGGDVIVELMGEGRVDGSGVIYLYNDDEVPSGQVRIPAASLSTDGGGQLDLFGPRGDGENEGVINLYKEGRSNSIRVQ